MKYDYYLHRSGGRVFDYFGGIGTPFKVSIVRFYIWKWLGYRATRVIKNASLKRIMIRAALNKGISRHCYFIREMILKGIYNEI